MLLLGERSRPFIVSYADFSSHRETVPKNCLRYVIPSQLMKAGFERIDKTTYTLYRKDFSGLLELEFSISKKVGKSYCWTLNEKNFKKMLKELSAIKAYLDDKAEEMDARARKLSEIQPGRERKRHTRDGVEEGLKIMKAVDKMKLEFFKRYRDFIDVNQHIDIQMPTIRSWFFCFDACKTTRELHLYFMFIELFLDIFWGRIKKSKTRKRKISIDSIKRGVVIYYALFFSVKRIRELYTQDVSFDELRAKFPMFSEGALEEMTLERGHGKGWKHTPSEFALHWGSRTANTTPRNFKQLLGKYKKFARKIKEEVGKIQDVGKVLVGETSVPVDELSLLDIEYIKDEDWIAGWRWTLSQLPSLADTNHPTSR